MCIFFIHPRRARSPRATPTRELASRESYAHRFPVLDLRELGHGDGDDCGTTRATLRVVPSDDDDDASSTRSRARARRRARRGVDVDVGGDSFVPDARGMGRDDDDDGGSSVHVDARDDGVDARVRADARDGASEGER